MVLVFYLLCIILMMFVRPVLNVYFLKKGKMAVYSALYFIPILALFHTIIGGLVCEFFECHQLIRFKVISSHKQISHENKTKTTLFPFQITHFHI